MYHEKSDKLPRTETLLSGIFSKCSYLLNLKSTKLGGKFMIAEEAK